MRLEQHAKRQLVEKFLRPTGDHQQQRAWEELTELVRDSPEQAWPIILSIAEAASTDDRLAYLGATLVEDLIRRWGVQFRTRLLREIGSNAKLRRAVEAAYLFGTAPDLIHEINASLLKSGTPAKDLWDWKYRPIGG